MMEVRMRKMLVMVVFVACVSGAMAAAYGRFAMECLKECEAYATCAHYNGIEICVPFCGPGRCNASSEICVLRQNSPCVASMMSPCYPVTTCISTDPVVLRPENISTDACDRDECPPIDAPVCASNGVSFANACFFAQAQCRDPTLAIASMQLCPADIVRSRAMFPPPPVRNATCDKIVCADVQDPVCTSNGTMQNVCFWKKAHCQDPSVQLRWRAACEKDDGIVLVCPKTCPNVYRDAVCASNGVVYANPCLFRQAKCARQAFGELQPRDFDYCWH